MRIVFIDTTLTVPPPGGATTFLIELSTALAARGDRVTVVAQRGPNQSIAQRLQTAGVEVRQDLWRASHLPEERALRLAQWVCSERVEVYVISISADVGWLALPFLEPTIATMTVVHSDGHTFYDPLRHYHNLIDSAVGVSKETHRNIVDRCRIPPARAYYIPYGVSSLTRAEMESRCALPANPDSLFSFAYVGRLVQSQKRVLELAPLAEEVSSLDLSFQLHVIGDGPERQELEREVARRGLSDQVKFWGWLSPSQIEQRFLELDALVLLSDTEGLPLALLEAMGHAVVPVITRLDSGNIEVIRDGENGFLAEVGDFPAFAERLAILAHDRERALKMRKAAWATSQEYSVELMVRRYQECFTTITAADFPREHRAPQGTPHPLMSSCLSRYPFWLRKVKSHLLRSLATARSLVRL
jgi:glycosyltransferase involved in cell wall biosynthesis